LPFDTSIGRGLGLSDLIEAIRDDRPARASDVFAFHVLDVLLSIEEATRSGRTELVSSTTDRPAPLDGGQASSRSVSSSPSISSSVAR
jgi:hypothetical protein